MFGFNPFYYETLRRYTVVFGTLFNDISVIKHSGDGSVSKTIRVPISYGPKEKFLVRLEGEPDLSVDGAPRQVAISLPVMSFEITGLQYDGSRKLNSVGSIVLAANSSARSQVYNAVPYNINFQLNILTRSYDDGPDIVEQILPFFTPAWTNSIMIMDGQTLAFDCPLVLNSVNNTDTYENDFKTRRAVIWTLDFTMKCMFFGPIVSQGVIQVVTTTLNPPTVDVSIPAANGVTTIYYDNSDGSVLDSFGNTFPAVTITITPGETANGQPTSNAAASIPANTISANSNYGYVTNIIEKGA